MPEEFDPENLEKPEPKYQTAGGEAIKSRGPSAVQNETDKLKQEGVKAAKVAAGTTAKAALIASGVGAGLAAVGGKAAEWLTEKVLNKGWWKALLLAQWPSFATISIILGLMLIIIVPAFGGIAKARRGAYGGTPLVQASVLSTEDTADMQALLSGTGIDYNAIRSWHFLQGSRHEKGTEAWADQDYGFGTTVGTSGCGPTSAAMVLKKYGIAVTPADTAPFCLDGHRNEGEGTSYSCFSALAKKYGLKAERISDWGAAKKVLEAGAPLIVSVHHSNKLPRERQFTSGGHFIVLVGIYKDQVLINDSSGRNKTIAPVSDLLTAFWAGYFYIHP